MRLQVLLLGTVLSVARGFPQSWQYQRVFYAPGVSQPPVQSPVLVQQHPYTYVPQVRAPYVYVYDPQTGIRQAQIIIADEQGASANPFQAFLTFIQSAWTNSVSAGQNFASGIASAFQPPNGQSPQNPQKKPDSDGEVTEVEKPADSLTPAVPTDPQFARKPPTIVFLGLPSSQYVSPQSPYVSPPAHQVIPPSPHHYYRSVNVQNDEPVPNQKPAGRAAISFQKYLALARQKKLREEDSENENESSSEVDLRDSDNSTTTTTEGAEATAQDSSELGQSIAQAKPQATSVAGPGGLAAAAPVATAVVGPGGMALSAPTATAVAGAKGNAKPSVAAAARLRSQFKQSNIPAYFMQY